MAKFSEGGICLNQGVVGVAPYVIAQSNTLRLQPLEIMGGRLRLELYQRIVPTTD